MNDNETTQPASSSSAGTIGAVKGLVEEHPVAMLAGGILLGALIAGAMSRPAKGMADGTTKGNLRRSFGRRAVQIAAIGAELAAAYVAGADSVVADNTPEPAPSSAPEPALSGAPGSAKPKARRISDLAAIALRTLGPMLTRKT